MGAGTDAHRVMSYNPFVALQWMLDGKTVGGTPTPKRGGDTEPPAGTAPVHARQRLVRKDEARRGSLEPGKLADFAVLDQDYLTVPVEEIARLQSLLTMVGGRIVYAAGPFADLESK